MANAWFWFRHRAKQPGHAGADVAKVAKFNRDCAPAAKAAVTAHERKMHRGRKPTFRAKRRASRR